MQTLIRLLLRNSLILLLREDLSLHCLLRDSDFSQRFPCAQCPFVVFKVCLLRTLMKLSISTDIKVFVIQQIALISHCEIVDPILSPVRVIVSTITRTGLLQRGRKPRASGEIPDQPAHTRSLVRVFTGRSVASTIA